MQRNALQTDHAPAAIGPYSQAITITLGGQTLLFSSGQIPLDPRTQTMVEGDVSVQTRQVLDNLEAVLKAGGATFQNVVKTTIFLLDLQDFAAVNAVYAERFATQPPARSTVQVARLPRDARVEIEVIAVV